MRILTRRSFVGAFAAVPALAVGRRTLAAEELPKLTVAKDPNCGCCSGWADHIRAAGFPVEIVETSELNRVRARLGVPRHLAACHTAEVDGYVIEGHVPARAIRRLLAERPQVTGLAVPGMPVGSPGMEVEGAPPDTYDVIALRVLCEHRYEVGDPVVSRKAGEQGDTDVHHALDLRDYDGAPAEAGSPMPLARVVPLDAVCLVRAGIELPDRQEYVIDRVIIRAVEPGAPARQPRDEALAGGLVTTPAVPIHQLPCRTIPSLPDPERLGLFFR